LKLPILRYPDQSLATKTVDVEAVSDEIREAAANLVETMLAAGGIGIAANQCGLSRSVIVVKPYLGSDGFGEPLVLINPYLHQTSKDLLAQPEGCLSFPGISEVISRHESVVVAYLDLDGKPQILEAEGFLARQLQHEIDHLRGNTMIDRVSRLKRNLMLKAMKKAWQI
jgi:peptide deformylase